MLYLIIKYVQFFIWSKTNILHAIKFILYSKFRETVLLKNNN